jgi:splicing factor 3A subunit 2
VPQIVKQRDPDTGQRSLLFQLHYPSISSNVQPRHRFMSTFEQQIEKRDEKIQYLLVAAEPYETVAFKIPNEPIDRSPERFFTHWDPETNFFYLQFFFARKQQQEKEEGKDRDGDEKMQTEEHEPTYEIQDINEEDEE